LTFVIALFKRIRLDNGLVRYAPWVGRASFKRPDAFENGK